MPKEALIISRNQLIREMDAGLKPRFLFFWGHTERNSDEPSKACLSQWYPSEFDIDGITYKTAEHYMMAEKARLFQDAEIEEKIIRSHHPKQAKQLGRSILNYDEEKWCAHRFDAVIKGNVAKFGQNKKLDEFLARTGKRILVEASPADKIWGIGLSEQNEHIYNPNRWKGQNLLGFALMLARQELQ